MHAYQRHGADLHVVLASGEVLILTGYFADGAPEGGRHLFVGSHGELHEVRLVDGGDDALLASYDAVAMDEKWSAYDDLVFLDLERIEPVVAALVAPFLGGFAGLGAAAGGAALVGSVLLGDDGGSDGGSAAPSVFDADVDRVVGGDIADTVVIAGDGDPGDSVVVTIGGVAREPIIDDDGMWTVTFGPDELPDDGIYEAVVEVTDPSGGVTSLEGPSVDIDTTPPNVEVLQGTQSVGGFENAEGHQDGVVIAGTGEAGATIDVEIQGTTYSTTANDLGQWTVSFTSDEIATGEYEADVIITATDARGNSTTITETLVVDTVAPDLAIGVTAEDDVVNAAEAANVLEVSGTAEAGASVEVTMQGVTGVVVADGNGNWSFSFDPATLPQGEYDAEVTAVATDAYGNSTTTTGTLHVDTTTFVTMDADQTGDGVINAAEQAAGATLTGTAEPGATVSVTMLGVTRTVTAETDGSWNAVFAASEVPAGEYDAAVSVSATDVAGNTETTTGSVAIDTETFVTLAPGWGGGDGIVNAAEADAGVTLAGTAEAGSQVQVTLAGVTRTATVDSAGNWAVEFESGSIPSGEYTSTATVVSTDSAGNSQPLRRRSRWTLFWAKWICPQTRSKLTIRSTPLSVTEVLKSQVPRRRG
ncbi:Ig-like domain (group 3) [Shimia gijangensis]|uniref:Ig-like domain (Group 3) n=1 Tax=Shimia gijangensis TaxID=1470563 RepID=A0A1M6LW89_9RHOB|nr:Ig-like domain-containing protein [Shimia gijangensis]SHJ75448.1 Ig-like domain (group 3) [Shimia gijangensis]